jgi:hypothetical protein
VGYADTVGSKTRNLRLAEQRNYSVIRSLHRAGMPVNTLVSVAVGEADGPDEVRNPENRRVEIISYVHGRDPKIVEKLEREEDKALDKALNEQEMFPEAETANAASLEDEEEALSEDYDEILDDEEALDEDEEDNALFDEEYADDGTEETL